MIEAPGERSLSMPPWRYQPEGPYAICAVSAFEGTEYTFDHFELKHLDSAMAWFVRFHIPPLYGRIALIHDRHRQVVVHYGWEDVDEPPNWSGTAVGFAKLAEHYDPAMAAIWEVSAANYEEVPTER